ncbi:MAG: VOC family protein [Gammaproteobacteria bacterium]
MSHAGERGVRSLGYIGIGVRSLDAWQTYATGVLGFEWGPSLSDGSRLVRMDDYRQRLFLTPTGEDDIVFAGWEVRDAAELRAVEARLQQHGVAVSRGSADLAASRGVEELLVLQDCDALATEIYFGPQIEIRKPFMPSQPVSGFKTAELGLGHIVLTVASTSATEAFYRDALGFRTTDYINLELAPGLHTKATFMRCNARHHSLAMVTAPLPKRLLHFMAEVETLDEVGRALERAHQAGVRISATLGRHSNDRMVSFYMESPSGFDVEYGFSGRLIDEEAWHLEVFDKAEIWGHRRD